MADDLVKDRSKESDADAAATSADDSSQVACDQWETLNGRRTQPASVTADSTSNPGENNLTIRAQGGTSALNFDSNIYPTADELLSRLPGEAPAGHSLKPGGRAIPAGPAEFLESSSASPQKVAADAAGLKRASHHDVKVEEPTATLEKLPDGTLRRTLIGDNQYNGKSTIVTHEEYVRDDKGNIQKNEDGTDKTRVLAEDKESKDEAGKTKFFSHTDNHFTATGKLLTAHTDMFREGKEPKNKVGELSTNNTYNAKDQLIRHESQVNNAQGEKIQGTDNRYEYDPEGKHPHRTKEMVRRDEGGEVSYEKREHTYKQFGDSWKVDHTASTLYGADKAVTGFLSSSYQRRADGSLESERTQQTDAKTMRIVHDFSAEYDKNEKRTHSIDVHSKFRSNGTRETETVSEFRDESLRGKAGEKKDLTDEGSVVTRTSYDKTGEKALSEEKFVQKWDGSIVKAEGNQLGSNILDAKHGLQLGNGNRLDAWKQLEKLGGDASNRDVHEGLNNLGKFHGYDHAGAVEKLASWGKGNATVGVKALETWGDGQASDGITNYLALGRGSQSEATAKHSKELIANASDAVLRLWNGADGSAKSLVAVTQNIQDVARELNSGSKHADEVQRMLNADPVKAAEIAKAYGRGSCKDGVCTINDIGASSPDGPPNAKRGVETLSKWGKDLEDAFGNLEYATGGNVHLTPELFDSAGRAEKLNENGEKVTEIDRQAGSGILLGLGRLQDGSIDPALAAETLLNASETPDGKRDAFVATENLFNAGVKPVMEPVLGEDGEPKLDGSGSPLMQPKLDADGNVIQVRSVGDAVTALTDLSGGVPSVGVESVRVLSTTKDASGNTVLDTRVGFDQFAKLGETLHIVDGRAVVVQDISASVRDIRRLGEPAVDAAGNPVPYLDAQGKPILDAQGKPISQPVAGAMAALELTRTKDGVDGAKIYSTLQTVTTNERAAFEKAVATGEVAPGATFSPAETTTKVVEFIGRQPATDGRPAETSGSALRGTLLLTSTQTAADGRSYSLSPDSSAVGALNTIRTADSGADTEKTMMRGATQVSLMSSKSDGTFISGASVTASLAEKTIDGQPARPEAMFRSGIDNVTAYSAGTDSTKTFAGGRETIAFIGGGESNPNAVPLGSAQIRTASDATTNGSVAQMARVTHEAGRDPVTGQTNPIEGAKALMTYSGRDGSTSTSYAQGATSLHRDLYGANSKATMDTAHVATAVSLASPTRPEGTSALQSGMDKTNALVTASQQAGYKTTNGADVLTNLNSNPAVKAAVTQASDAQTAVAAVAARPGTLAQIANPVVTQTAAATVAKESTAAVAAVKDATKIAPTTATTIDAPVRAAQPTTALPTATTERAAMPFAMVPRDAAVTAAANETKSIAAANNTTVPASATANDTARTVLSQSAATKPEAAGTWNPLARPTDKPAQAPLTPAELHAARVQAEQVARNQTEAAKVNAAAVAPDTSKFAFAVKPEASSVKPGDVAKAAEAKTIAAAAAKPASEGVVNNSRSVVNAVEAQRSAAAAASLASGSAKNVLTNLNEAANAKTAHGNVNVTINNANARAGAAAVEATKAGQAVISAAKKADAAAVEGARAAIQRTQAGAIASIPSHTAGKNNGILEVRQTLFGGTVAAVGKTAKVFTSNKPLSGKKLALTGAEIALAVMFISAAAAKQRDKELKNAKTTNLRIGSVEYAKMSDRLDELEELKQTDSTKSFDDDILIRPTWLVRQGEDLVKLAEHLFHEGELGWLIADINAGVVKETLIDGKRVIELKIRQKIELPVWQDIVRFHKVMPENARPENLITIVNETAVDTELMHNALAGAMGVAPIAKPVFALARNAQPVMTGAGMMQAQKEAAIAASAAATMSEAKPVLAAARLAVQKTAQAMMKKNDSDQGPTAGATADDSNPVLKPRLV